jgi:hypothetical protein
VFERLNTNAVKLGPFEILSAKFFKEGVNPRQLWAAARDEPNSVLGDPAITKDQGGYAIDPYLILQIISALTHNSPQQKAVLNDLTAADIKKEWGRVVLALKRVIEWLRDSCGVIHRELLPYQAALIPMTGGWLARDALTGPKQAAALTKIEQFFWATVFTTNYDQGGASQAECAWPT